MRGRLLVLLAVWALLLGFGTPSAVAAERIEVSASLVDAGYLEPPPTVSYTGNETSFTEHLRGATSWERWMGSPLLQGDASVTNVDYNAHYNCTDNTYTDCSVRGAIQVTWRIRLDAFDGGWEGTSNVRIVGFAADGQFLYEGVMRGSGWGELEGWRLFTDVWVDYTSGTKYYAGYAQAPRG